MLLVRKGPLAGRESGQRGIDIDIDRREFTQFLLQDFQIPARIERDLVVGNSQRRFCVSERPDKVMTGTSARSIARAA